MIYVLDTNILRKMLEHLPKKGIIFELLWEKFEMGITQEVYISVDECFQELSKHYDEKNQNFVWLKARKKIFKAPTNEESLYIKQIFSHRKMQDSVRKKTNS